jgi:hypothetical protein
MSSAEEPVCFGHTLLIESIERRQRKEETIEYELKR